MCLSRENWEGFVFSLQMCCSGKLGEELQARCVEHHTFSWTVLAAALQRCSHSSPCLVPQHAVNHVQLTVSSSSHFTHTKHQLVKIISPGSSLRL